jgi:transposase InsO family protein
VRAHPELADEAAALRLELPTARRRRSRGSSWHRHGIRSPSAPCAGSCAAGAAARGARSRAEGLRPLRGRPPQRAVDHRRLVGPWVPHPKATSSVRAKLFLIVDDHSRLLVHGRFFAHENARACQEALRRPSCAAGLPEVLYADNGAPFSNAWLARTCAVLGIRLVHSSPIRPKAGASRSGSTASSARRSWLRPPTRASSRWTSSNDLFDAWAEQVANRRVHAETNEAPIDRFERAARTAGSIPNV